MELVAARKRYGQVEALRGIDLIIRQGEVVAILGPNGAGKTTAINLALGLRRPTSGQVRLFGLEPTSRLARSRCGVMLQESGVNDALWVKDLVELFCAYYPHPMPPQRALALAGLEAQARTPAGKLSGGQRQRLFYALAICGDPEVLFLDEPTVGMDVESRRSFLDSIREFGAGGKTIILTTHYLEEADQLARRIVVIDHGLIVADAPPAEIKSRVAARKVSFEARGPLTEADFDGLPYRALQLSDNRVWLLTERPEEVLRALFSRGLEIRDLTVVGADLEEAFLALTSSAGTVPVLEEEASR